MDDLGRAMSGGDMLMLGGGNPAHIPEVQVVWRRRMQEILQDADTFERMLANYDSAKGSPRFSEALASYLNRHLGWNLGAENIAVTNGAQTALFCLINMFGGTCNGAPRRKILFPLMPEYVGYADQCTAADSYVSHRALIEFPGERSFKYRIDFNSLHITDDIGALCVSRPTNPSGNVLTDDEVDRLCRLAATHDVPLIIDNAYGNPFPGIIFTEARPPWNRNTILTFSLSKLGLPGTRTGIVVGPPDIIRALTSMNSVLSLASGNIGQAIISPLLESDELTDLCRDVIRPFYREKSQRAKQWIEESFPGDMDYYVHRSEGALFLWIWLRGLPISAQELYERLKKRRVLVLPGSFFFFGLPEPWKHSDECIRVTYSQADDIVREGIAILGDELRRAYAE